MKYDPKYYKYDEENNCYIDKKKRKYSALLSLAPMFIFSILTFVLPGTFKMISLILLLISAFTSKKMLSFWDSKLKVILYA